MGVRKILLSLSAALIVLSVAVVGIKGVQFGIEFVGGTSIAFHNTGDISIEDMRAACADAGEPEAVVQTTNADGSAGFLVRTTNTSPEDAATTANQIAGDLGISTDSFEVNTVGPDWGAGVIQSSAIAFAVSLLLIIAYIAIRFEYKYGHYGGCGVAARPHNRGWHLCVGWSRNYAKHGSGSAYHFGLFAL